MRVPLFLCTWVCEAPLGLLAVRGFRLDWASEQNPIRFPYRPLGPRRSYDHHVAGTEDLMVAMAAYEAACRQWPGETITLRQGARVIEDSRKEGLV